MISSPGGDPVEVGERLAVRRAVAGDRRVAELPRQRRVGVVAGPPLEVGGGHALDDRGVEPDGRDLEPGDGVAVLEAAPACRRGGGGGAVVVGGTRRHRVTARRPADRIAAWSAGRRSTVVAYVASSSSNSLVQVVLGLGVLDARPPQLVRHEAEHQQAGGDQHLADVADDPPPVVGRRRPIPAGRRSWGRPAVAWTRAVTVPVQTCRGSVARRWSTAGPSPAASSSSRTPSPCSAASRRWPARR